MSFNVVSVDGWWRPEAPQGKETLSGTWELSDAQITRNDDDFLDREQGIPHLKGVPCRIVKLAAAAEAAG